MTEHVKKILIASIGFYRQWVSPAFPGSCRFNPTCSAYALEAVDRYGAVRGSVKTVWRILKCHPWHPGGDDPVSPQVHTESERLRPLLKTGAPSRSRRSRDDGAWKGRPLSSTPVDTTSVPRVPRPAHSKR